MSKTRKEKNDWLKRLQEATADLTAEQKRQIAQFSKHVVWQKVEEDFKTINP